MSRLRLVSRACSPSLTNGNEHREFDEGYMRRRDASIDDYRIEEPERRFR